MADYVLRQCCADAPEGVGGFATIEGEEPLPRVGEVIARRSEPPKLAPGVAAHEAGHGVVAVALGGTCGRIVLGHAPRATFAVTGVANQIAAMLAGPIAQRLSLGWLALEPATELAEVIRRVEACGGGSCDACEAARRASILAPPDDQPAILSLLQRIEMQALGIIRDEDVRAANSSCSRSSATYWRINSRRRARVSSQHSY